MAGITNVVRYPNAVPASQADDPAGRCWPIRQSIRHRRTMARMFQIGPVPLAAERARTRMWARVKAGGQ